MRFCEADDKPTFACPICDYNVVIQIERGIRRCPECGVRLPAVSVSKAKVAWEILAAQIRRGLIRD